MITLLTTTFTLLHCSSTIVSTVVFHFGCTIYCISAVWRPIADRLKSEEFVRKNYCSASITCGSFQSWAV